MARTQSWRSLNPDGDFECPATENLYGHISTWDVSDIQNFVYNDAGLFENCIAFNKDISSWDVSSAVNMRRMFYNAVIFSVNLVSWNVDAVENFNSMFFNTETFRFDLSGWRTTSATDMRDMFKDSAMQFDYCDWTPSGQKRWLARNLGVV